MGVKNIHHITKKLIVHGMNPDTPVALVRWGTTPRQLTVSGTLTNIEKRVKAAGLTAPAIIVVGHVVTLRKTMKWFENRPLLGRRIVITRAREQAGELVDRLLDLGAECIECPTIKISPPDDLKPLDRVIETLLSYDWLIFSSVNAVNFFFDRLFLKEKDVRALTNLQIAAIGPATAARLFDFGLKSDIVPESYRAESVVKAFANVDINGKKILRPP
jgi:uroporphyrinogen III methyltransferase/synthase